MREEIWDARNLFNRDLVVRHWDDTEEVVQIAQLLGSKWDRFLSGPLVIRYHDGQYQRWALADLAEAVVGEEHPNEYVYLGEPLNQSVLSAAAHRTQLKLVI